MKTHFLKALIVPFTLALVALSPALLVHDAMAASVGPTGYTNSFTNQPIAADWASLSRAGAGADAFDMDTDVNANITALNVTSSTVSATADPGAANALASWSSVGQYLQTRPTGNRYTVLMGKFVNNSGLNASQIGISYLYTIAGTSANEDADKGTKVYYSLTGGSNSWVNVPALNTLLSAPTVLTQATTVSLNWTNGGNLYLLWVDDNAAIGTDLADEMDNFSLQVTVGIPPTLASTVVSPATNAVLVSGSPVVAAASVVNGTAPYSVEYFVSSGAGNTSFTSAGSSGSAPYNVTLGNLIAGTYNIYSVVTDSSVPPTSSTSTTNTFYVADPIVLNLTSPANGASFDNATSVSGAATVSGGTAPYSVQFYLDSVASGAALTASPFERNFGTLFVGDHTVSVTVTDAKGWVSNSPLATVHITGPLGVALLPTNGTAINFGQALSLLGEPGGGKGPYSVTFFNNGLAVGTASTAPFTTSAGILPVGSYAIYAQATDNSLTPQVAYSSTNTVTVLPNPVVVALSNPTNNQTSTAGQPFTIRAVASVAAPLTVSNVQFYYDGAIAGTDLTAPFTASVASPVEGVHAVYAMVTDSLGRTSYSATNRVTFVIDPLANDNFANRFALNTPATVTGANVGATTEAGEPIGTFFPRWGATLWYKWTAPVSGSVSVDTFGSTFDTMLTVFTGNAVNGLTQVVQNDNAPGRAPASLVTFNATQGTEYQIQVGGIQGFGGGGFLPPATGNLQLNLTMPPIVVITSPTNNSVFPVGSNIVVTATASSVAGTVTKVDFYQKGTFLGTATSAPYSIVYSNAPAGTNNLYAVVTDSAGQIATSAVVNAAFFNNGITLVSPADGDVFLSSKLISVSAVGMLPSGAITNVDFFADGVKIGQKGAAPFSVSWSNVTAGSHILTAVGTSDSGQVYNSQRIAIGVANTFIAKGATWKFLDNGSDQGTNWYLPTFNDSSWVAGAAELGYGDGDEQTEINSGPAGNVFITTYFRRTFVASNLSVYASLQMNVKRDDGAVVYLNGVEAARFNMNAGPVNYLTLAPNSDDDGANFWPAVILSSLLVEGTNVIAVEIHQTNPTSSDVSFDMEFLAVPKIIRNRAPEVAITSPADNSVFVGVSSVAVQASASDSDGSVSNVAIYADGVKIGDAAGTPYSFTWLNPPLGAHVLTAVATDDQGATTKSAGVNVKVYDAAGDPIVQITSPANGTVVEGPTNMLVTAAASALDLVAHVQFFANGLSIGDVAASPYSAIWTAPFGDSVLTAVVYGADGKVGTSSVVNVTITIPPTNTVAPTIASQFPPGGSIVTAITNITITFSEKVQGVDASDLLINGIPAAKVTGSGSNYVFSFPQPPYGEVDVSWAVGHGITDFGWPENLPFYELSPDGRWEYELIDRTAPVIAARTPAAGSLVTNLTQISVNFSEPVAGVDAADLLVNGTPAVDVTSNGTQYVFSVAQPPSGTVNITWNAAHGITDLAADSPNAFNGASTNARWSFTLDTRTIFIQTNSLWKFIKGLAEASSPTNAWRQLGFDDSSWSNAFAPFFYGDPYSNGVPAYTLLSDMRSNYTSIYLRKEFVIPNRTALTNLFLSAQSDDGFVAWVNGVEVLRYNVPAGELAYTNVAINASPEPQNNGAGYISYNLTNVAPLLVNGINVLTIHALNESLNTSSDFGFNAQLYSYLSDAAFAAPRLFQAAPTPGDVFYLTNITVTFSEPVSGVDAADLLVNGVPATAVTGSGAAYTFSFAQPAYGAVVITWATNHGIVDFDAVPKPFNGAAASSILRYTFLNPSAPTITGSSPVAGTTIIGLSNITVTFSEPVSGVDAADLLVNGAPAISVVAGTSSTYTFGVAQPPYGIVTVRWATNNGIQDLESPANAFDASRPTAQWSYNLVNPVPTVALTSPTNNSFYLVGSDISVRATATDNDGTISLVEFFENGNKLAESAAAPFTYTWSGAPLGGHTLRAIATDNSGLRATSAPVVMTVVTNLPATLLRGPYLQVGAPSGGVLRWRTDLLTDSAVFYGTDPAALTRSVVVPDLTNEHIVQVTGLLPDTRYYYSIGSSAQSLVSGGDYWFKTSPVPGTRRPVRFWALGDSGTANANARAVRDAYSSYAATNGPADFWLMLGDNAYNAGLDTEYQRAVFDMYPDTLRNLFLWPTIGNHESSQAFTAADYPYLHIFTLPQNAEAGGVPSGSPRYYSFDYANIHFISLDSMTSGRTTNTAMVQWLVNDLAATAQDWVIVFFHHPPYTKGSHNSDAETELIEIRQNIVPILEANGVDLVLSGHSHAFERSFLLNGHYGLSSTITPDMKLDAGDGRETGNGAYQKNISGQGVVYTVAGSSGQTSGGSLNHPAHFISLNELGSLVIDVTSNKLHAVFLATNGVARDSFDLLKRNYAPIAEDATIVLNEDTTAPVTLKASGSGSSALTYTIVSAPAHGIATYVNPATSLPEAIATGSVLSVVPNLTYTPASNFFGADSITFKATEGTLESAIGTINLVVHPVNDAPVADASATPLRTLLAANNLNATAVLDGSRSFDVEHDPLQFYWREGASLLATQAVSIVTLPIGPHNISLVVDDGQLFGTDSLLVEVLTAGQSVQRLMTTVKNGAATPKPLLASLEAARAAFERGNFTAAFNELRAFQNKVNAQVLPKDPALANQLNAIAQNLMDALSESTRPKLAVGKDASGHGKKVKFTGNAAKTYVIEASSDLVHWQQVGTATHTGNGEFEFDGASNAAGTVFFRVLAP